MRKLRMLYIVSRNIHDLSREVNEALDKYVIRDFQIFQDMEYIYGSLRPNHYVAVLKAEVQNV